MGDTLKTSNFRYAVLEHSGNDEDGYEHFLVSRHRTKAAAVRSWRGPKRRRRGCTARKSGIWSSAST